MDDTSFELGPNHVVVPLSLFNLMAQAFWGYVPDADTPPPTPDDVGGEDLVEEEVVQRFVPIGRNKPKEVKDE